MDFRYKCFLTKALERMPYGETAYYLLQKYVTKSLRQSDEENLSRYEEKVNPHFKAFQKLGGAEFEKAVYYEFGAGWDLFAPIGFSALGMGRLFLIDLSPLLHADEALKSIRFYQNFASKLGLRHMPSDWKPISRDNLKTVLKESFRIDYRAPVDAKKTGFETESVDYIVSNVTMEHIPADDIAPILLECRRLLKKDGVFSCTIDYQDHWAYFDKSISVYHYLSYERDDWKRYNPSRHYQNRLRHCDYVQLFENAGFEIMEIETKPIRSEDKEHLRKISLASCFQHYAQEDLLIRGAHFVLKKRAT